MSEQNLLIQESIRQVLLAIGEDPNREGLRETPKRVANMYAELFKSVSLSNDELIKEVNKTFSEEFSIDPERFGDMVIVRDIPFYSMCEHHLVPFFGVAHIGYIPDRKIIGLSKIARLVEAIAKRPQLQERITRDTANCLDAMLDPKGVMVVLKAEHLCMSMRGVKKPGSKTVTSAAHGAFLEPATRQEFLALIGGSI